MFSPFLLQPRSQRLCFSLKHGTFGDLWHRILAQALVYDAYIILLQKSRKPLTNPYTEGIIIDSELYIYENSKYTIPKKDK